MSVLSASLCAHVRVNWFLLVATALQAMALSVQVHARVWDASFFDQQDNNAFYSSLVPKQYVDSATRHSNTNTNSKSLSIDHRAVKKNRAFLSSLLCDLVRECAQDRVVETTLLELQQRTHRHLPIPLFTELETSADARTAQTNVDARDALLAFGAQVPQGDAAEPWRTDMAQRVLQNTMFNLTEELLLGKFRLDQVPRVRGARKKKQKEQ